MDAPTPLWIVRFAWLTLPFLAWAGPAAALDGASAASTVTFATVGWLLWAMVLVCSALVRPESLVLLRLLVPLAPAATAIGLLLAAGDGILVAGDTATILAVVGFVTGVVAAALIMLPSVGRYFLNGDSYGAERRYGLRCPGALVVTIGPLWLAGVGLPVGAVAALAAGRWALGIPALLIGILFAAWLWAVTRRLAQRYVVFVPAGLTLVDPLALADPVLFARNRTLSVAPAATNPAGPDPDGAPASERVDLSGGALGLAVELRTDGPTEVITLSRPSDRTHGDNPPGSLSDRLQNVRMGVPRETSSVLFTPSRPAEFLLDARRVGFGQG